MRRRYVYSDPSAHLAQETKSRWHHDDFMSCGGLITFMDGGIVMIKSVNADQMEE